MAQAHHAAIREGKKGLRTFSGELLRAVLAILQRKWVKTGT